MYFHQKGLNQTSNNRAGAFPGIRDFIYYFQKQRAKTRVLIGFENIISSNDIANASIVYTGKGVISDEQNVGWLMRFFAWVWPF